MSTEAALAARRHAAEAALKRVHDAITRLRREKAQVSVAAVARRAGVSRTFLYGNPDARAAVATAITAAGERRVQLLAAQDDEQEATWRERALNAEDGLKAAHAEIITQRARIGELLGQVRDLESEWTKEAIARSPPRTPPSSSASASSPPTTGPSKRNSRPHERTSASTTGASPTSKPRSPRQDKCQNRPIRELIS